jgi:chemotaxis protein methyltransferase CheR
VPFLKTYPSLKIWVAGCSTGEEVYSLAILLKEEGLLERTMIYATDINPQSLEKARRGVMPLDAMRLYTENYQKAGGTRSFSDYYTAAYGGALFEQIAGATTSPSPTTAWPPTACSPRPISSAAATS